MNKIDVGKLFELSSVLRRHESMSDLLARLVPGVPTEEVLNNDRYKESILNYLANVHGLCEESDLTLSLKSVERLFNSFKAATFKDAATVESQYSVIHQRIRDELSLRLFLLVDDRKARYYIDPLEGWKEVADWMPSAIRDIEEASKCLALDRHTACVFHCMRVAEFGLGALAHNMGIEYNRKNWDPVLKEVLMQLQHVAETPYPELEDRWKGNKEKYLAARERLTAIKDSLRNPTMHARGFYDEEIAEEVYRSVRTFMKNLSTWLVVKGSLFD